MERIIVIILAIFTVQITWARDPISDNKLAQVIDQFQYITQYREIKNKSHSSGWDSCWEYTINLETDYPGMTNPLEVTTNFYIPNRDDLGSEQIPMVILLPPMGGKNFLDEKMANTLCSKNIAAMIVTNDFTGIQSGDVPPVEDHEMAIHRSVAGVKAAMAFGVDDVNIDGDKLGIFGVSLGGVLGTFVMETQANLAAGYFVVAGGDIPYILANSTNDEVRRVRRVRMEEEGFTTKEEYEAFLRVHMSLDPFDLGRALPAETVNMVISKNDTTVPTQNQIDLHMALGSPDATYSNSGHVDTVIDTLFWGDGRRRIANFFAERFKLENPRLTQRWLDQFSLDRF